MPANNIVISDEAIDALTAQLTTIVNDGLGTVIQQMQQTISSSEAGWQGLAGDGFRALVELFRTKDVPFLQQQVTDTGMAAKKTLAAMHQTDGGSAGLFGGGH